LAPVLGKVALRMRDPSRYSSFSRWFTRWFTQCGTRVGLPDPAGDLPVVGLLLLLGDAPSRLRLFFDGALLRGAPFLLVLRSPAIRSWFPRSRLSAPGYPLPVPHSWFPLLAPRSGLSAPGYPSRLFVPGSRSRSLAPRLSAPRLFVPRFPLRVSSSPRSHQSLLDSTSCHAPGLSPPVRLPQGQFRGHCAGLLPEGILGVSQDRLPGCIPRLPAPASIDRAHLPGRAAPGGCLMRTWPSGWPYRPGEAPVLGVVPGTPVRAPRFAHAAVAGSSHAGRLPLLPIGRAAPGRRCSRRSAPGGSRGFWGPGPERPRPRRMPGRGRCVAGPGRSPRGAAASRLSAVAAASTARSPGHVLLACRLRGRARVRFPPAGLARQEGTRGSRRDASGEAHPARGSRQRPFARRGRRVCRLGPTALSCARRSSRLPATPRRTLPAPGELGVALAAMIRGGGGGVSSMEAHPGPPGRGSVRRATAHPGRSRAHRRAGGAVMPHYTRREVTWPRVGPAVL